jgi:hypothetical protein
MKRPSADRSLPDPDDEPTIPIQRAGLILGISRSSAYKAAREGRLPLIEVSATRRMVNTAEFLERYGLRRTRPPEKETRPDRPSRNARDGR